LDEGFWGTLPAAAAAAAATTPEAVKKRCILGRVR